MAEINGEVEKYCKEINVIGAGGVYYIGAKIVASAGNDDLAAGLTIAGGCCDIAAGVWKIRQKEEING